MKRFVYFAILASAAFCFGQTAHVSRDEEMVRKFVDDFSAAFSQNDAAALDRMTASDYTFVTPTGTIQNKEERMAPIRSGDLKYEYAKYDEVQVRVYGGMAIVTAHVAVKSELKGTPLNGQFRSTLTLLKVRGMWELVASQASAIN
ncbi:MAG TPA: nuclear transport factor 2 family protein [Edaphobacter sp.]|nr:nuclear transport factor 2 family protein [Edaphobacter sp.]